MTRNQKIAVGCGAVGCLGLIVLSIAGVVLFLTLRSPRANSTRVTSINVNRSSNGNGNANQSSAANTNSSDGEEGASSSSSGMSDDDKHKLFQAGAATQDSELVQRVWKKLGLLKDDGSPNEAYLQFVKDHVVWLFSNADFAKSMNTPEKARAYVEAHIND